MTKILMNIDLLEYQLSMKEALRQVLRENYINGIREAQRVEPALAHTVPKAVSLREDKLLPPPCIMCISLDAYEGQGDDFIGVVAYHDFAIYSMHITIVDDQGNLIESGEASPYPQDPELWEYLPTARVLPGTAVRAYVTATDYMDGIGRCWQRKTLGEA